ncbi:hypothetical protein [Noviherbaspirillum galbum]|uniref:Uncharacterized protein n=1 Tax=Noviherbaspirillum galbum TaxID=2709383 RepID=A0A6B3SWL7_9BURK|nr:hypothetical protein [Noviherbaspirillum galbum]NEX62802.1 hypothetical protein [Noviherbaspirillum galbum]
MKRQFDSELVITSLVEATLGNDATLRQRHLFQENLRSLVRLAKAEQVVEIKENVRRLTGAMESHQARRRAKAVLLAQRLPGILAAAQQTFEFDR